MKRGQGGELFFPQGDLGDVALSWSVEEILDQNLFKDKVEKIPNTFHSIEHYLKSFATPLMEETRSDLCACLEVISEAPYSKIQYIEEAEPANADLYYIDVNFWNNEAGGGNETYKARNGDFFILSSMKLETVDDLTRYDVSYCMALVTEVAMEDEFQKGFKVKASKCTHVQEDMGKYRCAIFLTNIMTNVRIWKALHLTQGMNNNFNIIKAVLGPRPMVDGACDACDSRLSDHWFTKFSDNLLSISLNESQMDAIKAAILTVQCKHSHLVKLIWGPPGTGKTKTVSALLWIFLHMKCRTLTCAPTNVAVVGVCSRVLQLVKHFHEHSHLNGLFYSLGNVVLFGNKDRMEIDDELHDVFLEYRVDILADCFAPSIGWKHRVASMISLFQECTSQYDMFLENKNNEDEDISFLEFLKKRFNAAAGPLGNCIRNLWIHLPTRYISKKNASNMFAVLDLFETFGNLLSSKELADEELKTVFIQDYSKSEYLPPMNDAKHGFPLVKALDETRRECLRLLKILQDTLNLPHGVERSSIQKFCLQNASLIFCTANSSILLHYVDMDPLEVLVIDEAAQLKECESAIPLRLNWLKHAILVGDEHQLPSLVKSQVCKEVGFGVSLFERLAGLGYHKHLLNMQYRMHPAISSFPNAKFYEDQILDGPNVNDASYGKHYVDLLYGPYAFINIIDGREEVDDIGNSRKNMVEVAVLLHLVRSLFKWWDGTGQKISIGVVSPYSSQVNVIKEKLGQRYEMYDGFKIRVKSIDGFQGEEDDVIILSTVRSNNRGTIGFLDDMNRTNVALTRARHCLWILGNSTTLERSGTVWKYLVIDAMKRQCFFHASDNEGLAKEILHVKHELDQLDDLLNSDSILLKTARWKVLFSDEFRKSFAKLKSIQVKREVIQMLLRLANGWRSKRSNHDLADSYHLARIYRVKELYLIWTIDIVKQESFIQVIRVWDFLPMTQIERLIKRLDNIFSMYTDNYITHCKEVSMEGKVEVPMSWKIGHDIIRYKKLCKFEQIDDANAGQLDTTYVMENCKVNESLLLMKFYTLTSGIVKHLLTACDGTEMDIPFELTDQEEDIIRFPRSTFILGRSGTGKTTVLTMKLIQKEQQHCIASEGLYFAKDSENPSKIDVSDRIAEMKRGNFLKQVFITVSPKLCSAIRNHIRRLKSFASGGEYSGAVSSFEMHDVSDNLIDFVDIPNSFQDLPQKHYPLVITFQKFLMMLDGTVGNSFFDRFYSESGLNSVERGMSTFAALHAFIQLKEVSYEKFVGSYWPHFNMQLTKKIDASTVFTQIISHIKGGLEAGLVHSGKLRREEYLMLSEKRVSTLSREIRERIYDIFVDYENNKCMNGEFDLSDFVIDLHRRLASEGYKGDELDYVYIDEVQDLTMRQIALLKYVCKNFQEGFTFAGDTAQTIARGIDFRFEDIRSLFYTEFLSELKDGNNENKKERVADKFQLNQNFRTHDGVLKLAQSIMDLLYNFFPSCVDKLIPETSLIYGEAPVLLECNNDENAIITIFGKSGSVVDSMDGFGAEQVILVRDDCVKKQILDLVGKQALVLTIVECKGLEFQDVLLYRFFGGSPLKNKWRVIYQYMKTQDILDPSVTKSFPNFDEARHNLLCSELKQLYVAITRTRQRLWICENTDEFCRPMFDYWKRLCLVQVRHLDSSLAQAMRAASSPEEWRLRGIKLFNEENFEMATMCFERAGDEYREKWARAAGLVATADRIISVNPEMGETALKKAAEIYESIGKAETAATCYIKLKDFKTAGMIYLKKCGPSRLEAAGDCFAMVECWSRAADVYAKANCLSKCLSMCSKGKLFDAGLQFIEQWKDDSCFNEQKLQELDGIKLQYLESCALYYYELQDIRRMMMFVKAFRSIDLIRHFLKSRNLLDELLMLEVEMGNYLEAANISRKKGDILLEAEMLEKAGHFEKATPLILFYVTMSSLWTPGSKGWPLKKFEQKQELLIKGKVLAKQVSSSFYDYVCSEVDILSDEVKNLSNMCKLLVDSHKSQNTRLKIFTLRSMIDVHLQSEPSKYIWESELVLDGEKHAIEMLSQNIFSVETLMHLWNLWKGMVLNVLSYLRLIETPDQNDFLSYEEFCLEYLGVRKQDNDNQSIYIVLNSDPSWIKNSDRTSLLRERNLVWMNTHQYRSSAQHYWGIELSSLGMLVLETLEALHKFSMLCDQRYQSKSVHGSENVLSSYSKGKIIISMYEVAKFLLESDSVPSKNVGKAKRFFSLAQGCFFDTVFPLDWRRGTTEGMITLHENGIAMDMVEQSIAENIKPKRGKLTHGQIGRLVILFFLTGQLPDILFDKIKICLDQMPAWKDFFVQLKTFFDFGFARFPLICKLQGALESTYAADWRFEPDYISAHCYIYLVEFLIFFASSCLGSVIFCTKPLLLEMLRCRGCKGYIDVPLASVHDTPHLISVIRSLELVIVMLINLLRDKGGIQEWVTKSSKSMFDYNNLIVKLVTILCLAHLNTGRDPSAIGNLLSNNMIFQDMPGKFSELLSRAMFSRKGDRNWFLTIFADALTVVENHLVVICPKDSGSEFVHLNALVIWSEDLSSREDVTAKLFPKNLGNVQVFHKGSLQEPVNKSSSESNPISVGDGQEVDYTAPLSTISVEKDQEVETGIRNDDKELQEKIRELWEKVESSLSGKVDELEVEDIIHVLDSGITLLKHNGPSSDCDENLLGEMRNLKDELLSIVRKRQAEPTYTMIGDIHGRWQYLKRRLQPLMDSVFSHTQETVEEVSQSDEDIDDAEECKQTTTAKAVGETVACSSKQSKHKKKKEKKKPKKKVKNNSRGKKT